MPSQPWRLLLVEDNPGDARLIQLCLQDSSLNISDYYWERDLASGLQRLASSAVDVVLLDLGLPDSLGQGSLVRLVEAQPDVPVIVLTGNQDEELALRVVQLGAQDYIVKGEYTAELLARTIRYSIERRMQEAALRESQRTLETLVSNLPGMVFRCLNNREYTPEYLSPGCQALTGYSPDEIMEKSLVTFEDLVHPDDRQRVWEAIQQALAACQPYQMEYRMVDREGRTRWVWERGQGVFDHSGEVLALEGFVVDISEQVKAVERVHYQSFLLEHINDAVVATDDQLHITAWNRAAEEMFGWPEAAVLGKPVVDYVIPELSGEEVEQLLASLVSGEDLQLELAFARRDGASIHVEAQLHGLRDNGYPPIGYVGVFRDISARLHSEKQLRLITSGLEAAVNGVLITNVSGVIEWANPAFLAMTGFSAAEVLGKTPRMLKSGTQPQEFYRDLWQTILAGESWQGELINKRKDGSQYHEFMSITPVLDASGNVAHFIAIKQDVTEQVRIQAELREREERLRMTIEASQDGIWENNYGLKPDFLSDRMFTMLGYDPQPVEEGFLFLKGLVHPEDLPGVIEVVQRLENGEQDSYSQEVRMQAADGSWKFTLSRAHCIARGPDKRAVRVVGTMTDVSLLRQTEAQAQRLADRLRIIAEWTSRLAALQDAEKIADGVLLALEQLFGQYMIGVFRCQPRALELFAVRHKIGLNRVRPGLRLPPGRGIVGLVAGSGRPYLTGDVSQDPYYIHEAELGDIGSEIAVPVKRGEQVIGVIDIQADLLQAFNSSDLEVLQIFADHLAVALENADLFVETRRKAEQFSLLYEAGLALNSVLEPSRQLEILFQIMMTTLAAERAAFFAFDPSDRNLRLSLGLGFEVQVLAELQNKEFRLDEDFLASRVARDRQPLIVVNHNDDEVQLELDSAVSTAMGVPAVREGRLLGVLNVARENGRPFDTEDQQMLQLFANQAVVAMENARLFEEIEKRLQQVQALHKIEQAISNSFRLEVVLDVILSQITRIMQVDAAAILLYSPEARTLDSAARQGFKTEALRNTHLFLGEGLAGKTALERRTTILDGLPELHQQFPDAAQLASEKFCSYIAIPLVAKGEVKGVLEIFHRAALRPDKDWLEFLETLATQAAIAINDASLYEGLQSANLELKMAYDTTLEGWSRTLEMRDMETKGHSQRVTRLAILLARELGMRDEELVHLRRGALLHDIGKMAIPDHILNKPGPLDEQEWALMRQHPVFAYELLRPIPFLRQALDIPYCHHEKWDGSGYPRGLRKEAIPLPARIFAVVDVWDALISERPYRPAWPTQKALAYLREQAGKHFDPQVVEIFLRLLKEKEGLL